MTLRTWMETNDKSAADVARGSGVPAPTLSRYLNGRNPLSADNAEKICAYTRRTTSEAPVTFEELMREGRRLTKKRAESTPAPTETETPA